MTSTTQDDDLVTAVLAASRALVGISVRSLAAGSRDVTVTQFRTLVVLAGTDRTNLVGLAGRVGVAVSTAQRMVDKLLAAGLVSRAENPDNRREVLLSLTPRGRSVVRRVSERRRGEVEQVVARMPARQRDGLVRALRSFAEAAGEPDPDTLSQLGW